MTKRLMRSPAARGLSVLLVVLVVRGAFGAPRDIMDSALPTAPTSSGSPGSGDVSRKTGSFGYAYPIQAPPGRLGVAPSLSLQYSSSAPIHGGVAAGWSLPVAEIRLDPQRPLLSLESLDEPYQDAWVSTASGSQRLVRYSDSSTRFFAQNDDSYTDYRRVNLAGGFYWEARTLDGKVHTFGLGPHMSVADSLLATRFPLTETRDRFGNAVRYTWKAVMWRNQLAEYRLEAVEYTFNDGAGLGANARVELDWGEPTACANDLSSGGGGIVDPSIGSPWDTPIGAHMTLVNGRRRFPGASELRSITTYALEQDGTGMRQVRAIELHYDGPSRACSAVTPIRQLTSITERAIGSDGNELELPPTTFAYGDGELELAPVPFAWAQPDIAPPAASWGKRHDRPTQWPELESMLVDLDADGLVDRLTVVNPAMCTFLWQRGTGTGFEGTPQMRTLPRLAGSGVTRDDGCYLNFQKLVLQNSTQTCESIKPSYFAYRFLDVAGGDDAPDLVAELHYDNSAYTPDPAALGLPTPTCGATMSVGCEESGTCLPGLVLAQPDAGATVYSSPLSTPQDSCVADPACMVGRTPYAASDDDDCDPNEENCNPYINCWLGQTEGFDITCPQEPLEPPNFDTNSFEPTCGNRLLAKQTGCAADFVWYVWENDGHGNFAASPRAILSPIPLDSASETGTPSSGGHGDVVQHEGYHRPTFVPDPFFSRHSLIDLNGDGHVDAVRKGYDDDFWEVFLGDGDGHFRGRDGAPIIWQVPEGEWLARGESIDIEYVDAYGVTRFRRMVNERSALSDLNGDGRPDLIRSAYVDVGEGPQHLMVVHYNDGSRFLDTAVQLSPALGGRIGGAVVVPTQMGIRGHFIDRGVRYDLMTSVDLDADGRAEIIGYAGDTEVADCPPEDAACLTLFASTGGNYRELRAPSSLERNLIKVTRADGESWRVTQTVRDFTGDGRPDVMVATDAGVTVLGIPNSAGAAPRLLTRIDNGRGAATLVEYAAHTNRDVVEQGGDDNLPGTTWVVASVQVEDEFGPTSTVSYRYRDPVLTADYLGRRAFRGFAQVLSTGPTGAVTVSDYAYDVDWGGRLATTRVYSQEGALGADRPHSVEDVFWRGYALHGGRMESFHRVATRSYACDPEQSTASCRSSGLHLATASVYEPVSSALSGDVVAWTATTQLRLAGEFDPDAPLSGYAPVDGDTASHVDAELLDDGQRYWLYNRLSDTQDLVTGAVVARGQKILDASLLYAAYDCHEVDTRWACGRVIVDAATGLTTTTVKPRQVSAASMARAHVSYDPAQLFPERVTNEIGHVTVFEYDYGTGAVLHRAGPNRKQVNGEDVLAEVRTTIDALGRPVAVARAFDDPIAGYRLETVSRATYVDADLAAGRPASVTYEELLDLGGDRWVTSTDEIDGVGRVFRRTAHTFGEQTSDAVTDFVYDASGKLVRTRIPDPRGGAGQVEVEYLFDSLGRSRGMRYLADGTGHDMSYPDARTVLRTDVVGAPAPGEPIATKQLVRDAYGRLVEVAERLDSGEFAITSYGYDAADNLTSIIDPDGVQTELVYDHAGNRVSVDRDGRLWEYGYDVNGNMVTTTYPHAAGGDVLEYTSSTVFDDLDRVLSRVPAPAELDGARAQLLLADRPTTWVYDEGDNGLGQLSSVEMPFGTISYDYDAAGRAIADRFDFDFAAAGYPEVAVHDRAEERTLNARGQVAGISYAGLAPAQSPDVHFGYDSRGMPASAMWVNYPYNGQKDPPHSELLAHYDRNVAGLVTRQDRPGYGSHVRTFTYDAHGRVLTDEIRKSALKSREAMTYYGNGDLRSMESFRAGATTRAFDFGYDTRHQLTVAGDDQGYSAVFEYTAGGRFASAFVQADRATVVNRDVSYEYDVQHREQLRQLGGSDGSTVASFAYDAAGNTVQRTTAAGSWELAYDGDQRQRVVVTGGQATVYYYGPGGDRLAELQLAGEVPGAPLVSARLWLGDAEIFLGPDGAQVDSYSHVHLGGQRVARIRGTSKHSLVYHNGLGHMVLAQALGNSVVDGFIYSPFGEVLDEVGRIPDGAEPESGATYWRRFNGKEFDFESGLYYYGQRYYDPLSMRWVRPDPLFQFAPDLERANPREANLFTFDLNNPLRYVDADGQQTNDEDEDEDKDESAWLETGVATLRILTGAVDSLSGGNMSDATIAKDPYFDPISAPEGAEAPKTSSGMAKAAKATSGAVGGGKVVLGIYGVATAEDGVDAATGVLDTVDGAGTLVEALGAGGTRVGSVLTKAGPVAGFISTVIEFYSAPGKAVQAAKTENIRRGGEGGARMGVGLALDQGGKVNIREHQFGNGRNIYQNANRRSANTWVKIGYAAVMHLPPAVRSHVRSMAVRSAQEHGEGHVLESNDASARAGVLGRHAL